MIRLIDSFLTNAATVTQLLLGLTPEPDQKRPAQVRHRVQQVHQGQDGVGTGIRLHTAKSHHSFLHHFFKLGPGHFGLLCNRKHHMNTESCGSSHMLMKSTLVGRQTHKGWDGLCLINGSFHHGHHMFVRDHFL